MANETIKTIEEAIDTLLEERGSNINSIQSQVSNVEAEIVTCKAELDNMLDNVSSFNVSEIVAKRAELETLEESKRVLVTILDKAYSRKALLDDNTAREYNSDLDEAFKAERTTIYNNMISHIEAIIDECETLEEKHHNYYRVGQKLKRVSDSSGSVYGLVSHIEDYKKLKDYLQHLALIH